MNLKLISVAAFCMLGIQAEACGVDTNCDLANDRHYRIYNPDNASAALVFAHGFGGSAHGVVNNTSLQEIAAERGFALIALKSAEKDWSIPNAPSKVTRPGIDELAYVDAVMADAAARFGISQGDSVVSGFSAGGMMVWTVACERGNAFAGYIPMAGVFWSPEPETCFAEPASLIHLHGTEDKTVPLAGRKVMDTHQGDVRDVYQMYAEYGDFLSQTTKSRGEVSCLSRTNEDNDILELCLYSMGHKMPYQHMRGASAVLGKN